MFWKNWDEEEKASAIRIAGLCVAALAVYSLIACISYLFHWKQDMSLIGDPSMMDAAVKTGNHAGKLGMATGRLLVYRLFGLGSLALIVILIAVSVRLLMQKWPWSMLRTVLICLSGAFVSSVFLAFIGSFVGIPYAFGGGLGGQCGQAVSDSLNNLIGAVPTALVIVVCIFIWLFFCSNRFNRWLAGLGQKKEKDSATEPEAVRPVEVKPVAEPEHVVPKPVWSTPEKPNTDGPEVIDIDIEPENPEPGTSPEATASDGLTIVSDDTLEQTVTELKPIDTRLDPPDGLPKYKFPSIELLADHSKGRYEVSSEELNANNNRIRATLASYKIQIKDVTAIVGPTVTLYKIHPAEGVKISEIRKLQEDIAVNLGARGVRVTTLDDAVGIEVANDKQSIVPLKALLNDDSFRNSNAELPVAIGYTIQQKVKVFDLTDAPHLLIAGATKQGKSVGLNVIVGSLLYARHPSELKFVFIDPKMVEFSAYAQLLHHYLAVLPDSADEDDERANAIVKKPKDAEKILRSLCTEMDERYELLSKAGVNNIKLYNEKYRNRKLNPNKGHHFLPYLVTIVDEYADLTMSQGGSSDARAAARSITNSIIRLAQKGRAAGIHVILATQRPSVDVISGIIKSNFPMRIAFRVASRMDSMTILDSPGAEKLIGKGDMLFSAGIDIERIQCGYVSGEEIGSITEFIGEQEGYGKSYNTPYYLPTPEEPEGEGGGSGVAELGKLDERFEEAARMVVTSQRGSTSDLQRKLGMGYAKAGRVMDQLEAAGIVGPQDGSKPRQVLISDFDALQAIFDSLNL